MGSKTVKLPLSKDERDRLRISGIRLQQIPGMRGEELSLQTGMPIERADELVALATFQTIPDIGPVMAQTLVRLRFSHPNQLMGRDPACLLDELEGRLGYWVDPCVEDQLRLVVYCAEHPEARKRWWDFTEERKAYRSKHGYPGTRPTVAWNDPRREEKTSTVS